MSQPLLPHRRAEEFRTRNRGGVPAEILAEAAVIVEGVRSGGEAGPQNRSAAAPRRAKENTVLRWISI